MKRAFSYHLGLVIMVFCSFSWGETSPYEKGVDDLPFNPKLTYFPIWTEAPGPAQGGTHRLLPRDGTIQLCCVKGLPCSPPNISCSQNGPSPVGYAHVCISPRQGGSKTCGWMTNKYFNLFYESKSPSEPETYRITAPQESKPTYEPGTRPDYSASGESGLGPQYPIPAADPNCCKPLTQAHVNKVTPVAEEIKKEAVSQAQLAPNPECDWFNVDCTSRSSKGPLEITDGLANVTSHMTFKEDKVNWRSVCKVGSGVIEAKPLFSSYHSACHVDLDNCNLKNESVLRGDYSPQVEIAKLTNQRSPGGSVQLCQAATEKFYSKCDIPSARSSPEKRRAAVFAKISTAIDQFKNLHPNSAVDRNQLACVVAKEDASFESYRLNGEACDSLKSHAVGLFQMQPKIIEKVLAHDPKYCGEIQKLTGNDKASCIGKNLYNQISINEDLQIQVGVRAFDYYLSLNGNNFQDTVSAWLVGPQGLEDYKLIKGLKRKQLNEEDKIYMKKVSEYTCQIETCYTCMKTNGPDNECFLKANRPCVVRKSK